MNMTRGPNMPITPKYFMKRFFSHIVWNMPGGVLCSKPPPYLPSVHSIHMSGIPKRKSDMKYGIMKAPPPFDAAWTGKRRKLPRPTALPATAIMMPSRVPHAWRFLAMRQPPGIFYHRPYIFCKFMFQQALKRYRHGHGPVILVYRAGPVDPVLIWVHFEYAGQIQ